MQTRLDEQGQRFEANRYQTDDDFEFYWCKEASSSRDANQYHK